MDLEKIFQNLDLKPLLEMTSDVMTGRQPQMKEYEIKVNIPQAIIDTITPICEQFNVPVSEVLSSMATEGLNAQIKTAMGMAAQQQQQQSQTENPFQNMGVDLSGLTEKFQQLEGLGERLNQIKKVFDEINPTGNGLCEGTPNPGKNQKDPT